MIWGGGGVQVTSAVGERNGWTVGMRRIRRDRSWVTLGELLPARGTIPMRVGRREAGRLCDQIEYSRVLDRGTSDLKIGRILMSISSLRITDQGRRVGHGRSLRGCTQGCWHSCVPLVDWRVRGGSLRIQNKVQLRLLVVAVVVVVVVVVVRILILSQRLLWRG
jgi:hypothetical protein